MQMTRACICVCVCVCVCVCTLNYAECFKINEMSEEEAE
jgi:hypothetical protein